MDRSLSKILGQKTFGELKKEKHPKFVSPMLATLTEDYFNHPDWIYERKLDGVRCVVSIRNNTVSLYSRNENDMSKTYFEITESLEKQNYPDLIADGEIVAFEGKTTSFSKLQPRIQLKDKKRLKATKVKIHLYLFDIIYFDGYRLEELPLRTRKKILKKVFDWGDPIHYTPHRNEKGQEYLKEACNKNWEGLIAKNATAPYAHSRSREWLKFKCGHGQELVIGGFTETQGQRVGFGALLVGYYKNGKLQYAGKVGTGFDDDFLEKWRKKFDAVERKTSPFEDFHQTDGGKNHWVEPKFVGQFGFTEWTKTNKLRHPRFLGMRNDKKPTEVVKEESK